MEARSAVTALTAVVLDAVATRDGRRPEAKVTEAGDFGREMPG
jgi:hypothetical protein